MGDRDVNCVCAAFCKKTLAPLSLMFFQNNRHSDMQNSKRTFSQRHPSLPLGCFRCHPSFLLLIRRGALALQPKIMGICLYHWNVYSSAKADENSQKQFEPFLLALFIVCSNDVKHPECHQCFKLLQSTKNRATKNTSLHLIFISLFNQYISLICPVL